MNIALVYPEVSDLARYKEDRKEFPPFGPLYLAAVLERAGHHVALFRANDSVRSFDFRDFAIVGFSIPSSATYSLVRMVRFSSLFRKDALVLVGGVHANFFPEETAVDFRADIVGIGESETAMVAIAAELESGSRNYVSVAGIGIRLGMKVVRTAPDSVIHDINLLPFPSRHLLPKPDIVMNNRLAGTDIPMAHVMFSRGCPFSCRFCAAGNTRIQYRSGESARRELEHLMEAYSIQGFAVVDDNFIVNRRAVTEICKSITPLGLAWSALSRIDTINEDLLDVMAGSGCLEIKYGIESGSQRMLDAMDKRIRVDQIIRVVEMTHRKGIGIKAFVIHGYPGENIESTRETIQLLDSLANFIGRVSLFRFVPLPGSYVYGHSSDFGLTERGRSRAWEAFHIYHNDSHWWGTLGEFEELEAAYAELNQFIASKWPGDHN